MEDGLGGGVELPGGLWVLLISWAGIRSGTLPRTLSLTGVVAGVAGVLTVLPASDAFESAFGLGLLVWFAWAGVTPLRERRSDASGSGSHRSVEPDRHATARRHQ